MVFLLTCTGFKGAFVDASGDAFKANATLYLQGACGAKISARAIDLDGDGTADGIDLNGDGIADVRYIPIIANQLAGLDINGDGKSDYFMTVGLNDAVKITTEQSGGNEVTLTADAAGQVTGFDLTGDCNADNTIIADLRTDTTPPTSSANSVGGAFNAAQSVTLTCTDNFACNGIAYTLDGSTPNFNGGSHYVVGASGSVTISEAATLHYFARDANGNLETNIHSLNFIIVGANVALPPTYTPAVGYYTTTQNVALTNQTAGATICYTTNVTNPTCTSTGTCAVGTTYSSAIVVTNVAIIRAVACKIGLAGSPMVTLAYAVDGTAPGNVSSFTTTPGDTQVSLSWVNPADADLAGIRIVRKTGGYPANVNDGTVVYTAVGTSFTDTTVVNGTQYYYKAFTYDGVPNYASGVQATATPSAGAVNQPTYSPIAATYASAQNVTISSTTPGALICYTTSGATPACNATPACTTGTTYASAVNMASTATLKAIACKAGLTDSSIASGVYTIDTVPPGNVSPLNATPGSAQINLSWTNPGDADFAGVKILRKTGSYPANATDGTVVYNSTGTSIADTGLTNGTQYYYTAFSYDTIGNYASGTQATATPLAGTANAPSFSPTAGLFNATQNVTISSTTGGALICYTTNGTTPVCNATPACTTGSTYSSAVSISSTATLKALACAFGYSNSGVTSGTYTIDTTPPGNATSFTATPGNAQVNLSWINPGDADFAATKILRKTGSYPANATDGTVIYDSNGTGMTDTGLTDGVQYYYTVFAYDTAGNYASGTQATATPLAGIANAPTFTPAAGLFNATQNVTISSTTGGAVICYTTNGTTPACNATPACTTGSTYSSAVAISSTATLKALACAFGYSNSGVTSGAYTIDTTPPGNATSFNATPGNAQVNLTWINPGDSDFAGVKVLRKTGSYPANNTDGTVVYNGTGTAATDTGLTNGVQYYYTVFAYDTAGNYASGTQATATPLAGVANAPSFSPTAGLFNATQNVTISSSTGGALICYTTNGTTPACNATPACTTGSTYSSAVAISSTATLKALACAFGYSNSGVTSGAYTIDTTPPGNVTSFTATPGNAQVNLSWINPGDGDFAGVKVLRKTGSYPANNTDGTVVYNGTGTSTTDTSLTNGTQYYYTVFAYDTAGNYASGTQATATPTPPDSTPPTLLSSTPNDAATGVATCTGSPCTGKIVLVFSESMNTGLTQTLTTAIYGTSYVSTPNTGTTFTWSTTTYANDTLTINISWYWFPEQSQIQYTLATSGLQDVAGNAIAAQIQRSFTTTTPVPSFTVPDTGQTQCSSGASGNSTMAACPQTITGQDGDFVDIPTARSYAGPTLYGGSDYTTKDNTTNLIWKTCAEGLSDSSCATGSASTMTWYNALNQCAALNTAGYGGKTNWRLPTSEELESITDRSVNDPVINATYFPATVSNTYWSSSAYFANTTYAWYANFKSGISGGNSRTGNYYARCVAGSQPLAAAPYTDNGDGTVTDARTNLRWQKCSRGQNNDATCSGSATSATWVNAIAYCQGLSLASKTWRLPSMNELLSIVDRSTSSPAIKATYFPATVSNTYWSSTTYVYSTTIAWDVSFVNGYSDSGFAKANTEYVRCVTTGP